MDSSIPSLERGFGKAGKRNPSISFEKRPSNGALFLYCSEGRLTERAMGPVSWPLGANQSPRSCSIASALLGSCKKLTIAKA